MGYRKPTQAQRDAAQAKREGILANLADGIDRLADSDEWKRYLDCQAKFRQYSFGNTMLILCQRPDATRVASFKTWKELGRFPTNGSGIYIWAPHTKTVEKTDRETGEKREGQELGFHMTTVHDVSDTFGDELPEPVKLLEGEAPEGLFGKLTEVAKSVGFRVQVQPEIDGHPGANGLCEFGPKLITVAGNRSSVQQVKSLAHEIAHAKLHENSELPRGLKELEAESSAYVACQSLGLDTSDYSLGYVAGWSGGDPEKTREAIKASGARIHEASKTILDGLEAQAEKSAEAEVEHEDELEVA
jgi:hypothetical protein